MNPFWLQKVLYLFKFNFIFFWTPVMYPLEIRTRVRLYSLLCNLSNVSSQAKAQYKKIGGVC